MLRCRPSVILFAQEDMDEISTLVAAAKSRQLQPRPDHARDLNVPRQSAISTPCNAMLSPSPARPTIGAMVLHEVRNDGAMTVKHCDQYEDSDQGELRDEANLEAVAEVMAKDTPQALGARLDGDGVCMKDLQSTLPHVQSLPMFDRPLTMISPTRRRSRSLVMISGRTLEMPVDESGCMEQLLQDDLQASPLDRLMQGFRSMPSTPDPATTHSYSTGSSRTPCSQRLLSGEIFYRSPRSAHPIPAPRFIQSYHGYTGEAHGMPPLVGPHARQTSRRASTGGTHRRSSRLRSRLTTNPPHVEPTSRPRAAMYQSHGASATQQNPLTPHYAHRQENTAVRVTRVKVYDDTVPALFQPQTPAELRTRNATVPNLRRAATSQRTSGVFATDLHPAMIPPGESRYPNMRDMSSDPDSPVVVQVPARRSSLHNRHASVPPIPDDQENMEDDFEEEMQHDRRTWTAHRSGPARSRTLENTPPQEGRFERYLR